MPPIPDPYRVLGVAREATVGEIRTAHRRLAKQYHPDATGGDTERFLAVQEAYQVLSDPLRRREWDARHRPGPVRADTSPRTRPPATRGGAPRGATTGRGQTRRPRPVRGARPRPGRVPRAHRAPRATGSGVGPIRSRPPAESPRATRTRGRRRTCRGGPAAPTARGRPVRPLRPTRPDPRPTPPPRRPRARPRQPPGRRIARVRRAPTSTSTTALPAPPGRWPRGPTSGAPDRTCRVVRPSRSASAGRRRRARRRGDPDRAPTRPAPRPPPRAPQPRRRPAPQPLLVPRLHLPAPRRPWVGRAGWSSAHLMGPCPGDGAGGRKPGRRSGAASFTPCSAGWRLPPC